MDRQLFSLLILMFFAVAVSNGCTTFPQYQLQFEQPHKDITRVLVRVPARLDARGYRRIVRTEFQRVFEACGGEGVPIYELRFDFMIPTDDSRREERVASYCWKLDSLTATHASEENRALILY